MTAIATDYIAPSPGPDASNHLFHRLREVVGANLPPTFQGTYDDGISYLDGICMALGTMDGVNWPKWDDEAMCRLLMVGQHGKHLANQDLEWILHQCGRVDASQLDLFKWCMRKLHKASTKVPNLLDRTRMLVSSQLPVSLDDLFHMLEELPGCKGTTVEDAYATTVVLDELIFQLMSMGVNNLTRVKVAQVCTTLMLSPGAQSVFLLERLLRFANTYKFVGGLSIRMAIDAWSLCIAKCVDCQSNTDGSHILLLRHMINLMIAIRDGVNLQTLPGPAFLHRGMVLNVI